MEVPIGLWRLGLPELYVPDVPASYLDDVRELVRATAQILVRNGGITRRGVIEVDLATLGSWPRPASGTGRFIWSARWMRGPIHDHAWQIVLAVPGSRGGDAQALVAALNEYAGIE